MATTTTYGALSASDHSAQLRKAVIASTIGTAIEWYDFFLYGTAAGLIFGKLFFPGSDPLTATLLSFGTYFIGFVGGPIGAAHFWSLRRSYRPESNAHRYAAVHGHRDLPHRLRPDLRFNRYLGCGHLDGFADDSGHRRWW